MKITGSSSGSPISVEGTGEAAVEGIASENAAGESVAGVAGAAAESRAAALFAERLTSARESGGAQAQKIVTTDITAELKAGTLGPAQAMDRVVERVLTRQLGTDAASPAREQLRSALQEAIASDPLLTEKLRSLA